MINSATSAKEVDLKHQHTCVDSYFTTVNRNLTKYLNTGLRFKENNEYLRHTQLYKTQNELFAKIFLCSR